jgi:hypothetical protein
MSRTGSRSNESQVWAGTEAGLRSSRLPGLWMTDIGGQ